MSIISKIKSFIGGKDVNGREGSAIPKGYGTVPKSNSPRPWKDGRDGQLYFSRDYKVSYRPKSSQSIVRPVSQKAMSRVRKAEFDADGRPKLLIVRKTVDDVMSRTVPRSTMRLELKQNHEKIWNEEYANDLAYVLYVLGFNSFGVVNSTWLHNNHEDINRFLDYIECIGGVMDRNEQDGSFVRMNWTSVKSASWLLFHAKCYRQLPAPFEYIDDIFKEAEKNLDADCENMYELFRECRSEAKRRQYDRPPTKPQLDYAYQIYRRLLKAGRASMMRPNLATFGTVGAFIGKWEREYLSLGSTPKNKKNNRYRNHN